MAGDARTLDLSLLRDEPAPDAAAEANAASSEGGADGDQPAEETLEEVAGSLTKCYNAERNPSDEARAEEGFQSDPSDSMMDADLYYDIMSGVWDGRLSELLMDEVDHYQNDEQMGEADLEAFLEQQL